MNYPEIENVIKHIHQTCKCIQCHEKYDLEDIHIVATTKAEGLFETRCKKCKCATIITVLLAPEMEIKKKRVSEKLDIREHGGISKNDILDMKNFLNKFDGNFKRLFINSEKK